MKKLRSLLALCLFASGVAMTAPAAMAASNSNLTAYLAKRTSVPVCMKQPGGKEYTWHAPINAVPELLARGSYLGPCVNSASLGDKRNMGDGYFQTYTQRNQDGTPWAIGIVFPASTLNNLPTEQYDGLNCFDINHDGTLQLHNPVSDGANQTDECSGGHERELDFASADHKAIAPFKWALVNFQMHGHSPNHVYTVRHFDFHFYTQDVIERNFIRVGPCGLLVDCDDFKKGMQPLPAGYVHPDYMSVGAVESRMGDHMIDRTAPEWNGGQFIETWMFGKYEGKLTFWEPMITVDYFKSKPMMCKDVKLPQLYREAGYYPSRYCIRYRQGRDEYTVSLEGFVYRTASPY